MLNANLISVRLIQINKLTAKLVRVNNHLVQRKIIDFLDCTAKDSGLKIMHPIFYAHVDFARGICTVGEHVGRVFRSTAKNSLLHFDQEFALLNAC